MNKVFYKRFWSQKFTFNTRINPQENFFFSFYFVFLWIYPGIKSEFLKFVYAIKTPDKWLRKTFVSMIYPWYQLRGLPIDEFFNSECFNLLCIFKALR
jgi:hypothetical protein